MKRLLAALLVMSTAPALAAESGDIRDLRVGMKAADLPDDGYTGFACRATPDQKLDGWQDWRSCPADASGRHELRFEYDDSASAMARVNDKFSGTKVGGHPVLLSLLVGEDATVAGIRVVTDPSARLFLRKKAFLLAEQVKAHYGPDGWTCTETPPGPDRTAVGGEFFDEHCEKTTEGRHLMLDRQLFRRANQDMKNFVGRTELLILVAG